MSTDLYGIRVLNTKPETCKVTVKVFVVYYDVSFKNHQPLPKDHSFFFRILWDKGDTRFGAGGPIGEEVTVDQKCDEVWVDNNSFRFIKNVEQLSTMNFPVEDYSGYADFYYERNGVWEDEDKLVQATYEIEVTNAKYIKHLREGMSWGTTSYETQAWRIDHANQDKLPDITKPIIQLNPFKEKSQESGTLEDVLFSEDNSLFFVLSTAGEIACYQTADWTEIWRQDTEIWFGRLEYHPTKKLIWVQDNSRKEKVIFNFFGEIVKEKIWPEQDKSLYQTFRSPSGNYFLDTNYGEKLAVYDAEGNLLWEYESESKGELFTVFFSNEDQLLLSERPPDIFKIFDLPTGKILTSLSISAPTNRINIDPTGRFISFRDRRSTKIVEVVTEQTVFEYGTWPYNGDFLGQFIWSPSNIMGAIITTGEGARRNNGYGGYVTIYPIGIKSLATN